MNNETPRIREKGKKRSPMEKERDLCRIAELYLEGKYRWHMAEIMGLSVSQVDKDLKIVRERWEKAATRAIEHNKSRELAKLDKIERDYWDAWHRSIGVHARNTVIIEHNGDEKTSITTEKLVGDARYIQGVERCIEQRCKILGINAQTKYDVEVSRFDKMSDEELLNIARSIAQNAPPPEDE